VDFSSVLLSNEKRFFDRILIEGVGNACHALPNQGIGLRVNLHIGRVRNLFDTYGDLHFLLLISL
jgi:hypothetical protein